MVDIVFLLHQHLVLALLGIVGKLVTSVALLYILLSFEESDDLLANLRVNPVKGLLHPFLSVLFVFIVRYQI